MKEAYAIIVILAGSGAMAQNTPVNHSTSKASSDVASCLIVKHASTSRQIFVSGANWQYVAGEFPKGMKWKSNVTDGYIRKIKEAGGLVVIVPQAYSATDLEDARKQCSREPATSLFVCLLCLAFLQFVARVVDGRRNSASLCKRLLTTVWEIQPISDASMLESFYNLFTLFT